MNVLTHPCTVVAGRVVPMSHTDRALAACSRCLPAQAADQACDQSEMRNQSLEAQLYERLQMKARDQSAQGNR